MSRRARVRHPNETKPADLPWIRNSIPHMTNAAGEETHDIPDATLIAWFATLKSPYREVADVLYGLGGRGRLMGYDEIAEYSRRHHIKKLTAYEIKTLEYEAKRFAKGS